MDLRFRKPEEVVGLLYERLRKERLYLEINPRSKNLMLTIIDGVNIGFGVHWSPQQQSQVDH